MGYLPYNKYRDRILERLQWINLKLSFILKINGEKPTKEFILSLDTKMKAKVLGIINVLEEKGTQLREPYSKHLHAKNT